ncbi:SusC/RagA family TonB-linked outer membrane protein [Fulvivirgaceae bacterium PWU5]|uniref:SusC/RagA family TonB-linked outer membrane protein n=1 Tax=Dawidia cretensis TaxID=2782350 RepID=A0AAP2GWU5_9BACT|nr:SusC/RagA family TonB-linked outer membrane protein [Dawidia cretensis]MBT1711432.1 SusC/RagA family TonB-linked outer membrane protein [Dawidia cretensis]
MRKYFTKRLVAALALLASALLYQQAMAQVTVSGKVVSEDNESLPGVSVMLKGTLLGTTTDAGGRFTIAVPGSESVLILSFVGYVSEEVPVGNQTTLEIRLVPDLQSLQEVVVIGYGTQKKENVTTAIASVKEKDFTTGAMRDASELIKGKVAGLVIDNGSGDPGEMPNISLRGVATISGSTTPLILINGVPGDFNTAAPADIVSIEVLKDASAAAIYGTRGANGVILITTRGGARDRAPSLAYTHYSAVSNIARKPEFLTAGEYLQRAETFNFVSDYVNEAEQHGGIGDTDWLDLITRTAYTQNHNLSLQGGGASSTYALAVNYISQEGIFLKSGNDEFRVSLDLNQYLLDDKVTLNINVLRGVQKREAMGDGNSFNTLIYRNALIRNPLLHVKDEEGNWIDFPKYQYYNPLAMIEEAGGDINNSWTRLTSNLTVEPIGGWKTNLMLAQEIKEELMGYAETKKHYSTTRNGRNGFASRSDDHNKTNYLELTSQYAHTLGDHNVTLLGGYSYQYNVNEGGWVNNYDFPTDKYSYSNLEAGNAMRDGLARMASYKNDNALIGFFGRAAYTFRDKFNVLASVRREGSSKFGANYKWGTFPSASASWLINKEPFLANVNGLTLLKLRAGYGVTGVIPRDSYQSKTALNYDGSFFYNNGKWVPPLQNAWNPNPDLRWEKSQEVNVGVDFELFNRRITGSVDGYVKKTKDLLFQYRVPQPPNLAERTLANVGKMENRGIEVLLRGTPVRSNNFEWNSMVTMSRNKNELLSLSNDLYQIDGDYINTGDAGDPISMTTHRVEVGQPLGNFWGLKSIDISDDGLWVIELPGGERKVMDDNVMSQDPNRQILGNGIPKFRLGWTNTFRYKSFDLSVVMNGAFGFQILNFQRMFYENPNINYNVLESAFDNVYGKRLLAYTRQAYVSYYIEDGDYLKLDNATLGYNFNVAQLKFIRAVRLYVSGSNLATITGYKGVDPEIRRDDLMFQGNDNRDKFPSIRTYTVGVNVNF